jgi:hypothetical protein
MPRSGKRTAPLVTYYCTLLCVPCRSMAPRGLRWRRQEGRGMVKALTERTHNEHAHALAWFQDRDWLVYSSRLLSPFSGVSSWHL